METGNRNNHVAGFTLLEILIVLMIIALLLTTIMPALNLDSQQERAKAVSSKLHADIGQIISLAIIKQKALGITFYQSGYAVVEYLPEQNRWQLLQQNKNLQSDDQFNTFQVHVTLSGKPLKLHRLRNDVAIQAPQWWVSSDGFYSPFSIDLVSNQRVLVKVHGDTHGELLVEQVST